MNGDSILLLENSEALATMLLKILQAAGYDVMWYDLTGYLISDMASLPPKLIILDTALLTCEIVELVRTHVESHSSLLLLIVSMTLNTSKATELPLKPDDYLIKPFGMTELLLRVRTLLQGVPLPSSSFAPPKSQLIYGNLTLDRERHKLIMEGQKIHLTAYEFKVLQLMMVHPQRVFTRAELFKEGWGEEYLGVGRPVDNVLSRLRKKIGSQGESIEAIKDVGYRLR